MHVGAVALVMLASGIVAAAWYYNHPAIESNPDTSEYLRVAERVADGHLVDPARAPGYPLFIVLLGRNLQAVSVGQLLLFVLASAMVYAIVALVTERVWIALVVALVMGTNLYLISWVKPLMSEGLALWAVVSLALAAVLFLRRPSAPLLWLIAALTLLALFTRVEFLFLPVLLFALLTAFTWQRGLLWHALAATVVVYAFVAAYIAVNAFSNGYPGVTWVERVNLFGKVLQYRMHDEAPSRYSALTSAIDNYLRTKNEGTYAFAQVRPEVQADNWKLAGSYALAAAEADPIRYAKETARLAINSSVNYWTFREAESQEPIDAAGPFVGPLHRVLRFSRSPQEIYPLFPLAALAWFALWLARRREREWQLDAMIILVFLGMYDVIVVSAGAYGEYPRLYAPIDPIKLIVLLTCPLLAADWIWSLNSPVQLPLAPRCRRDKGRPAGAGLPAVRRGSP